jgi:sodium/proline symporter
VVQGLLMLAALIAVPIAALGAAGGWANATAAIEARSPTLLAPLLTTGGRPLSLIALLSLLGWGLGYFGQPHILARFMAVRSPEHVKSARRIAMSWVTLAMTGAVLVGLAGIAVVDPPLRGPETEKVFIVLVQALMHPIPAGICLAAILAAVMSTADSQLLVASSALAEDLYRPLVRRHAGERELLWVGRLAVILIALVAFVLALDPESRVLELVAYAWAGFGASFGPTLLLALWWRRMTRTGALAGMITGGLTVIVWKQLQGGVFDLYELVPGFLLSTLAIVVASLLSRPVATPSHQPPA